MSQVIAYCLTHGREHRDDETDEDYTDLLVRVESDGMVNVTPCTEDLRPVVIGTVESVNEDASDSEVSEPVFTLRAGDLAYIDTVAGGLVPCRVRSLDWTGAEVQVTASRPGWERGDVEHFVNPAMALLHRYQVKVKHGEQYVIGTVTVIEDEGTSE